MVFLIGYTIFRQCNNQKDEFKMSGGKDMKIWGKGIKLVDGKLLASGWWGVARHANYLGDIVLAVSFSLPCIVIGVPSSLGDLLLSYGYPLYLIILLVQREYRDEQRCRAKYQVRSRDRVQGLRVQGLRVQGLRVQGLRVKGLRDRLKRSRHVVLISVLLLT